MISAHWEEAPLAVGATTTVLDVPGRGLDHGAYVPLVEMYPAADVPVLQISMPSLDPVRLMEIGRKLAPLRDEGVLIIGSGFFTHNLRAITGDDNVVSPVMAEFDDWGRRTLAAGDVDALLDFERKAPGGRWPTRAPSISPRCSSRSARPRTSSPPSAPSSTASGSAWPAAPCNSADPKRDEQHTRNGARRGGI